MTINRKQLAQKYINPIKGADQTAKNDKFNAQYFLLAVRSAFQLVL